MQPEKYFNLDDILVIDVETDGLHDYTTIHCVVASDLHDNEYVFRQPLENRREAANLLSLLRRYRNGTICGHNFLGFDLPVMDDYFPGSVHRDQVLDTLVVSRLLYYNRPGGHSLQAWGERYGIQKEHSDLLDKDFETFSEAMIERCISDVRINVAVLKGFMRFLKDPEWQHSIWLEHFVQGVCQDMKTHGFRFDTDAAQRLYDEVLGRVQEIDELLSTAFPARRKHYRSFTPRKTKKGTLNAQDFQWARKGFEIFRRDSTGTHVVVGSGSTDSIPDLSCFDTSEVHLYVDEPFNPGSVRQIVERMNEAGWKPTEKTKGHIDATKRGSKVSKEKLAWFREYGWKVSETNLSTLPPSAPEAARRLAERLILASRLADISEWLTVVRNGRIHGNFNGIGAWTHRLSHNDPNTANIPVGSHDDSWMNDFEKYVNSVNNRMRSLFLPDEGHVLVGTDADGIQMRIFAHYVNDDRLIQALVTGDKANGTDIHTLHKGFLGDVCPSRDHAKTFIYAFLLGAGIGKVSEIFQTTVSKAKTAVDTFLEQYPGLKALKQKEIPRDAKRGYFTGLDGRKVIQDSEHLMLSGYLQNGEKVIMARWIYEWMTQADREGIPYKLLVWVHDETQTSTPPEYRQRLQEIQLQAMVRTGEILGMKLPLLATTDHGGSWRETH